MSPSLELALVLNCLRQNDPFVFLRVFIDEADTHTPNIVVGGYVAKVRRWDHFDKAWRKALQKRGLSYFHAVEMWGNKNEFKDWTAPQKEELRKRIYEITDKKLLFGFTVRLDEDDYQRIYIGENPRTHRDSKYGLCLRWAFCFLPDYAQGLTGETLKRCHYILETGHPNFGDCDRIFSELKNENTDIAPLLGTFTGGDKKDFPGLQAADALTSSAAQWWDHIDGQMVVDPQDARPAVQVIGEHCPVVRFKFDAEILHDLKQEKIDYHKMQRRAKREAKSRRREKNA